MSARLGLGMASFIPNYGIGLTDNSDDSCDEALQALVADAVLSGVQYIDAAPDYGAGDKILGALSELMQDHHVQICTKLNLASLTRHESSVEQCLAPLRQKSVDTFMLHNGTAQDFENPAVIRLLRMAKDKSLARLIGASTYGLADAAFVLRQKWCDVVQVEYSILNPSVVKEVRNIKRPQQQIVVRSVLCKGLLTSRRKQVQLDSNISSVLDQLEAKAQSWGFDLEELAIRYALDTAAVDVVLVGVNRPEELQTMLAAYQKPALTDRQMEELATFDHSLDDWSRPEKWRNIA